MFQFLPSIESSNGDVVRKFGVPVVIWLQENFSCHELPALPAFECDEVFGDGFGVRMGGKLGHMDTVGDNALMNRDPGIEFSEWLLQMYVVKIVIEEVTVLNENKVLKKVECSCSALGLMLACLGFGFGCTAAVVFVPCEPDIVDANPESPEELSHPLLLFGGYFQFCQVQYCC
jgi:hypothetical protein